MQKMFFSMLFKRIQSKSPKFYVTLRWLSGLLAFVCGAVMALMKVNYLHLSPDMATQIYDLCSKVGAGITGAWAISWTGTADPALLELGNTDTQKPPQQ